MGERYFQEHWQGVIQRYCLERSAGPGQPFLLCRTDILVIHRCGTTQIEGGDVLWFDEDGLCFKRYADAIRRQQARQEARRAAGEVLSAVQVETELAGACLSADFRSIPVVDIRGVVPSLASYATPAEAEIAH